MRTFFISSTFRDMQAERDMIHKVVFPAVRKKLKKYGEYVEEVDLRWGVDTLSLSEEESGHMVMRVCIDAIDRCVPYFIVLLGERYGWIPQENLFANLNDSRFESFEKDISITEMEIRYGALEKEMNAEKCIFCFRNPEVSDMIPKEYQKDYLPESEVHQEKLNLLKQKIRARYENNIIDYTASWDEKENCVSGLEQFAKMLEEKLMELIVKEGVLDKAESLEERIAINAEHTKQQHSSIYVSRPMLEMKASMGLITTKHVWLSGEAGTGKTAFLTQMAVNSEKSGVKNVIYYGGNPECADVDTFLKWMIYELEKNIGRPVKLESGSRRYYMDKIIALTKLLKEQLVVYIDAIDQMDVEIKWVLVQLALLQKKQIKFIVTSVEHLKDCGIEEAKEVFSSLPIKELTDTEVDAMIRKIARRRGKSLDVKVRMLIGKKKSMRNPLCLSLMMQRLFMMDATEFSKAEALAPGMYGISRYMQALVMEAGESVEELVATVIAKVKELMQDVDVDRILGMLSVAPQGLRMCTLLALNPEMNNVQIEKLLYFLYDVLEETEDGRWVFKHRLLKKNVREHLCKEKAESYAGELYDIFLSEDVIRWEDVILLGKETGRTDWSEKLGKSLGEGTLDEECFWILMERLNISEMEEYLCLVIRQTKSAALYKTLLKGIATEELSLSRIMEKVAAFAGDYIVSDKISEFYYYGAKHILAKAECTDEKVPQWMEKQYAVYSILNKKEADEIWTIASICIEGCKFEDLEIAKKWHGYLSKVIEDYGKIVNDTKRYILLNEILVWYHKFYRWMETKSREDCEQVCSTLMNQYQIASVNRKANVFSSEDFRYHHDCMVQIAGMCKYLESALYSQRVYDKFATFLSIAYVEYKGEYQAERKGKTAIDFVKTALSCMICANKDTMEGFYKEAIVAARWLEEKYDSCFAKDMQGRLYSGYAKACRSKEINQCAIEVYEELDRRYPTRGYKENQLYCYRNRYLMEKEIEPFYRYKEKIELLQKTEQLEKELLESTSDEYFQYLLHTTYLMFAEEELAFRNMEKAREYLERAEEFLKCEYIQQAEIRWTRGLKTWALGAEICYLDGDYEKVLKYIDKTEELLQDEEERNQNAFTKKEAVQKEKILHHIRARILWETNHNPEEVLELLKSLDDEEQNHPGYLLKGEIAQFQGKTGLARICFKNVRKKDGELMPWRITYVESREELWQYITAIKATFALYELTKDEMYRKTGLDCCNNLLKFYSSKEDHSDRPEILELWNRYYVATEEDTITPEEKWLVKAEKLQKTGKYEDKKEAADILDEKISQSVKENRGDILEKIYILRKECAALSKECQGPEIYAKDCQKLISAYVNCFGLKGEHEIEILRLHGEIAKACDHFDRKAAWKKRAGIIESIRIYMIRKDILSQNDLMKCLEYYDRLYKEAQECEGLSYKDLEVLIEFPKETFIKLYQITGEEEWLEKALNAISRYRELLRKAGVMGKAEHTVKDKIAISFAYDLDVYEIYLKNKKMEELLVRLEVLGREILANIPEGFGAMAEPFIEFFAEIDDQIIGKSLEIKDILEQLVKMRSENTDVFWGINKLKEEQKGD